MSDQEPNLIMIGYTIKQSRVISQSYGLEDSIMAAIKMHYLGHWGLQSDEEWEKNNFNLAKGLPVKSTFQVGYERIVITTNPASKETYVAFLDKEPDSRYSLKAVLSKWWWRFKCFISKTLSEQDIV